MVGVAGDEYDRVVARDRVEFGDSRFACPLGESVAPALDRHAWFGLLDPSLHPLKNFFWC